MCVCVCVCVCVCGVCVRVCVGVGGWGGVCHPFHTDRLTRVSAFTFGVKSGSNPGRTRINPGCNPGSNPACEVGSTHIYPG